MTIPSPPADNSGGYFIGQYTNGSDTHRYRYHVRAFDSTGTYLTPGAGTPTTVMADFTGEATNRALQYNSAWVFSMVGLFQNNMDGTFTELFGWTAPATVAGSGATATATDQGRAAEAIFNFKDGHGGRGRACLIAIGGLSVGQIPQTLGGSSSGSASQKLIDYLTNPVKTNIISHGGHQFQSPSHFTTIYNRRLRRHYGFA